MEYLFFVDDFVGIFWDDFVNFVDKVVVFMMINRSVFEWFF